MATEKRLFDDNAKFIKEDFYKRLIRLDDALRVITPEGATSLPDDQLVILLTARKKLKSVPIVDAVEVVHGRWEDMYDGKYANPRFRCSACKEKSLFKDERDVLGNWRQVQALTDYCPNCGAKMDGDGNGTA